jgi:hydrogenase small subunit
MAIGTHHTDGVAPRPGQPTDFLELARQHDPGEVVDAYPEAIGDALARVTDGPTEVAWLQGQSCTGCTMSMLQTEFPDIEGVISEFREAAAFHPTLMTSAGADAVATLDAAPDVLVVEGSIPVDVPRAATLGRDERGDPKPVVDWVIELAEAADVVVAVGSCAAYGGLPAAGRHDDDVGADPTGARGLQFDGREPGGVFGPAFESDRGLPVVNVPGCPSHPEHFLLTLATLLNGHDPALDEYNRPLPVFGPLVHDHCALREAYERGNFADTPGEDGCLYEAGCAGVYSYCDDSKRLRNGGTTICRDVGAPCIGCVEPAFWDRFTPFYEPGEDRCDPGRDDPAVGADEADEGAPDPSGDGVFAAARPVVADGRAQMRGVGVATAVLAALVVLPTLPVALPAAVLARRAGLGDRAPDGPVDHEREDEGG